METLLPSAGLLALLLIYGKGLGQLWKAAGTGRGVGRSAALAFVAGWLTLAIALVSPLEKTAESLLTAHMIQHMLLLSVAPPLLVLGRPAVVFIWAFPRSARRIRLPRPSGRFALAAVALHAAAIWFWHLPLAYQAALQNPGVHILEHASFLGSGILFWWTVLGPGQERRARLGQGLLMVAVTAIQAGALGALLALSRRVWYPTQTSVGLHHGLTPLEDQQLAGLIMWVPGGLLYVIAAALLFLRWLSVPRAIRTPQFPRTALFPLLLVIALGLGGCGPRETINLVSGGDAERGRMALGGFGCGACHEIAGVRSARGVVGPPLDNIGARTMIAGEIPNTPENLVRWIRNPQAIEPTTAMPNLGVGNQVARDMAAYLYTLR